MSSDSPYHEGRKSARGRARKSPARPAKKKSGGRKSRRRRGRGGGKGGVSAQSELTSHPTTRNAYVETRAWLLRQHGATCAYCGSKGTARLMTLDHVAPRRGQKAYDRRDNLVLACQDCNMKKRDLAPLAFLLGARSRAVNLLRYGAHLSAGLLDLAKSLVPAGMETSGAANIDHDKWGAPIEANDDSPYRD